MGLPARKDDDDRPARAPLFSVALDRDPAVVAWLAGLDVVTRRKLRDDLTPKFKEVPSGTELEGRTPSRVNEDSSGLDDDERARLRALFIETARDVLPPWKLKPFVALMSSGAKRNTKAIAREVGMTRSTVRTALDGKEGRRASVGAIDLVADAVRENDERREEAAAIARIEPTPRERERTRILSWFKSAERVPAMVPALSLLLVAHELADSKREVPVTDLLGHFPRSLISPCLALLKAHAMASSDGRIVRIARIPVDEESA